MAVARGYQRITALVSSTALTVPGSATYAVIVARKLVRWRDDGTAVTADAGMLLVPNQYFEYKGPLSAIRFIQVDPAAELDISYYSDT